MYSPKIDEELIPRLYRLRKLKKIPMTRLVNGILEKALSEMEEEEQKKEIVSLNADGGGYHEKAKSERRSDPQSEPDKDKYPGAW